MNALIFSLVIASGHPVKIPVVGVPPPPQWVGQHLVQKVGWCPAKQFDDAARTIDDSCTMPPQEAFPNAPLLDCGENKDGSVSCGYSVKMSNPDVGVWDGAFVLTRKSCKDKWVPTGVCFFPPEPKSAKRAVPPNESKIAPKEEQL